MRSGGLTGLVPSLNSRGNRVQDNCEVERLRMPPFMRHLFAQDTTVFIVQLGYAIKFPRVLSDQSTLLKDRELLVEVEFVGKVTNVLENLFFWNPT